MQLYIVQITMTLVAYIYLFSDRLRI